MSKQYITRREFDSLVEGFKVQWEMADRMGQEGKRTEAALKKVLSVLDIEVAREWEDGDVVYRLSSHSVRMYFVKRGGEWYSLTTGTKRSEAYVNDKISRGIYMEWTP